MTWCDRIGNGEEIGEEQPDILDLVRPFREGGKDAVERAEDLLIASAMRRAFGIQADAALLLGVSRRRLNYMLEARGARPKDIRESLPSDEGEA